MAGISMRGNPAGIRKRMILPILFFFFIGSALYGQGGVVHSRSFVHEGILRQYLLYVPAAYNTQEGDWPLVINYHGYSSSPVFQMNVHTLMNFVADTAHFLIAYPQGLVVQDIVFGGSAPGWNIPGSYNASHDDVAFTDSLIDHIDVDFRVDLERVHATGWSNGGEMSLHLACELSDRIASVASVANAMNELSLNSCQAGRPFSTLLIHGTADPIFPWGGIPGYFPPPPVTPSFWASHNNCLSDSIVTELPDLVPGDNCTVTLIEYIGCDENTEVLFYRVNNGGHPWPGGGYNGTALGNKNMDISASSEIWNFFKRNPMPNVVPLGVVYERSFVHDDSLRSYLLYVPNDYTGQEDWPLVINYHGFSINGEIQMDYTNMSATADTAHFLVAYPNGLIVEDLVFGGFGPGWYIPGSYGANHNDVTFTSSLIDHIDADFNIDLARVHATGWSNGGEFSYYLACMLPDRIASTASVSNAMNEISLNSCQAGRSLSTLLIHGTEDPFFPWNGVSGYFPPPPITPSFWASNNNCSPDSIVSDLPNVVVNDSCTVTLIEYQNCDPGTEVLLYRINGGGHTWPGSVPRPGWEWLGHTNQDIDANSVIWNFFKRNPTPPIVGIADNADHLSKTFRLYQNYPNPFNPATTIKYSVLKPSQVELKIYNALGQLVATLVDKYQTTGEYSAVWDGKDGDGNLLASGIYFYRIQMGEFNAVRKMTYLK